MLRTSEKIVNDAFKKSNLNQQEFAKMLGVSQSQVSKYIRGKSSPSSSILIHCMNIIDDNDDDRNEKSAHEQLTMRIKKLGGDHNKDICSALLNVIDAYENTATPQ